MANRFVQVTKANTPFELVERDIPEPGPGQVGIKVQAYGICHSDSLVKDGMFPGIQYPRVQDMKSQGLLIK
jgi:D-arabinose 1-dehydrogenase-like Zn-dependent alcohol dehydrogenase